MRSPSGASTRLRARGSTDAFFALPPPDGMFVVLRTQLSSRLLATLSAAAAPESLKRRNTY